MLVFAQQKKAYRNAVGRGHGDHVIESNANDVIRTRFLLLRKNQHVLHNCSDPLIKLHLTADQSFHHGFLTSSNRHDCMICLTGPAGRADHQLSNAR